MTRRRESDSRPLLDGDVPDKARSQRSKMTLFGCLLSTAAVLAVLVVLTWFISIGSYDINSVIDISGDQMSSWKTLQDVERWPRWDVGLDHAEIEKVVLHGYGFERLLELVKQVLTGPHFIGLGRFI